MTEFKIAVLGSAGVGKTALTINFLKGNLREKYDPKIEDFYRKLVNINGQRYMLEILDTSGTEQFTAMRDLYIKNGEGFILVYSIASQATFEALKGLKDQIIRVKNTQDVPMVLVGNKVDLDDKRTVSKAQGQELAKKFNCTFMETSAKNKINVDKIFYNVVRKKYMKVPVSQSNTVSSKQAKSHPIQHCTIS